MCSDTDNEVHRFAEDDDKVENLSIKSFPSDIESQCCHEFQTACLAEENKNTYGVRGEVTDAKGDSLDTVCCIAVATEKCFGIINQPSQLAS